MIFSASGFIGQMRMCPAAIKNEVTSREDSSDVNAGAPDSASFSLDSAPYSSAEQSATLGSLDSLHEDKEDSQFNLLDCPRRPPVVHCTRVDMFYGLIAAFVIWAIIYGTFTHFDMV